MKVLAWLAVVASSAALATSARADVTMTDLQVIARALSFMEQPLQGTVRVGILHAPNNPRSSRQAQELRDMIGSGFRGGNVDLRPVMVRLDDAATADVDLFFLTEYVAPGGTDLAAVSAARRIPCVTTDIEQVRRGTCVMGVRSRPKVEILVNRSAAVESGMTFATVFRVMITEL